MAHTLSNHGARSRLFGMAGLAELFTDERNWTGFSDNNILSDSDSDTSNDDDRCRSEGEQKGSSPRKYVRWDEAGE